MVAEDVASGIAEVEEVEVAAAVAVATAEDDGASALGGRPISSQPMPPFSEWQR
jgi:hypothetical protein